MGIETAIIALGVGSALFGAVSAGNQAEATAKATVAEGDLKASELAKDARLKAARAQTSFLNSGLLLEGSPMASIDSIFTTGLEDVAQTQSNAQTAGKNAARKGRSDAIGGLLSATSSVLGGVSGMGGAPASPTPAVTGPSFIGPVQGGDFIGPTRRNAFG